MKLKLKREHYIILIILAVVLVVVGVFLLTRKPLVTPRTPEERLEPGTIGEETENPAPLPSVVSNTSGMIKEVQADRLIVQGYGSNFADREPRILGVIFIDSTVTKQRNAQVKYQGLKGLKYLEEGMEISIKGAENLRGKIEFEAALIIIF